MSNLEKKICESFVKLLLIKPFTSITVNDIVLESDVSRSTFYNYFYDKYDVLNRSYSQIIDPKLEEIDDNFYKLIIEVFSVLYENQTYFKKAVKIKGDNSFSQFLVHYIYDYYKSFLLKKQKVTAISEELESILYYTSYGSVALIKKWIIEDYPNSVEEFTNIMIDCLPSIIRELFEV